MMRLAVIREATSTLLLTQTTLMMHTMLTTPTMLTTASRTNRRGW